MRVEKKEVTTDNLLGLRNWRAVANLLQAKKKIQPCLVSNPPSITQCELLLIPFQQI